MQRVLAAAVLAAMVFGGWKFFQKYEFQGLDNVRLEPRGGSAGGPAPGAGVAGDGSAIKIASFNIQILGPSKVAQRKVMDVLCDIVRRFDIVAIQEVRSNTDDILPRFIEKINAGGRRYDYLIGPRLGRSSSKEQYAFIFDKDTIETDRTALYTVEDRADLLHREPLVASFRVRGPPPSEAFTFTLINAHTDPDEVSQEVAALAQAYHAVRNDGRGEDDIILLGDLNADERKFGPLGQVPNIAWVISGVPTNTRGDKTYDNILFHRTATSEFTGLCGVVNLMRDYQLTLDAALEVSDHQPVWAEFSAYEGGQFGRVAERAGEKAVR
jgi:endonuclease/exonuclease/phosphatase family metal-dependent hydrolase